MSNHQNHADVTDKSLKVWVKLLKLLNDTNAPLRLYDDIMDLATTSFHEGYQFSVHYPSRKQLLQDLCDLSCMNESFPVEKDIILTDEISTMNVVCFDFEQMCYSILSDEDIMSDGNLTFPNKDSKQFQRLDNDKLSCIEDGDMFQNTAKVMCREHSNDFCLGIKMFIDATHTDVHSNWILDPVMFTFTFFKNEIT